MSAELHRHTARQTLGTAYNLRPATVSVRAGDLQPGQVVMESDDHPAVIVSITRLYTGIRIHARYIWSGATERDWELGFFHPDTRISPAEDGEY
ncbi:hypothetical protein [Cryobacterium sp. M25]|uniref:hypothetical protein n=1 Tax=Cryobacterium sp. M25 TaxID=2048293 RepID=UPI000CE4294F|nr:hypothetical protein [Cryobacterium sp. M25]